MSIQINGTVVIDTSGIFNGMVLESNSGVPSGSAQPGTLRYHSNQLYVYNGSTWVNLNSSEAATGGTEISDGVKRIHEFLSSGTLTVNYPYSFNYEILAGGGGGGGGNEGGGGAAGGYRTGTVSLSSGSYPVTVGAGGAGRNNGQNSNGGSGGNSVLGSVTSAGGGGGGWGRQSNAPGASGGCGGGGGGSQGGSNNGGSGNTPSVSPSQGFPGGLGHGYNPAYPGGGGGGGIGSAGTDRGGSWTSNAGIGGNGATVYGVVRGGGGGGGQYYDSGQPCVYAGSGGSGGGGGGGGGCGVVAAVAGTANYGAGGGGTGWRRVPGAYFPSQPGGSGLVVVSYSY